MDHTHLQMNPSMMTMPDSVILPFEDFDVDADHNLGRANGNCYQRKPGIANVHDGQIMVRLKKKRFIVIDYSVVPSPTDIACANVTPHLKCPPGAGSQKCTSSTCSKIGVPVCLFDSEPDEPMSLYLRSGLCFTCQRLLNEKRRTQRKRKGDNKIDDGQKRFRLNGQIFELDANAVIIDGPLDTKHHGPGYEYPEIMEDLHTLIAEMGQDAGQMFATLASLPTLPIHNSPENIEIEGLHNSLFHSFTKGVYLLSQWKASLDMTMANSVAEKATEEVLESATMADVVASAAAVAAVQVVEGHDDQIPLVLATDEKEASSTVPTGIQSI